MEGYYIPVTCVRLALTTTCLYAGFPDSPISSKSFKGYAFNFLHLKVFLWHVAQIQGYCRCQEIKTHIM